MPIRPIQIRFDNSRIRRPYADSRDSDSIRPIRESAYRKRPPPSGLDTSIPIRRFADSPDTLAGESDFDIQTCESAESNLNRAC